MTALVIHGDARQLPLPDESVDLIVTSPPYYALRSYTDDGEHYGGQIGSEATPAEYLDALWACTTEWVRVLKPEGSLWVNLGDKYSQYEGERKGHGRSIGGRERAHRGEPTSMPVRAPSLWGVRPKSLMGIPWRYTIGCIDQLELILRQDQIWSKSNSLPESVTDRTRRSHEYWFHLVKMPRYYAAVDEIREVQRLSPGVNPPGRRDFVTSKSSNSGRNHRDLGHPAREYNPLGKLPGSVWEIPSEPLTVPEISPLDGRPLPDHFAAFCTAWPRRLILGWSPPGICTECGEGRRPVTHVESVPVGRSNTGGIAKHPALHNRDGHAGPAKISYATITGYGCACPEPTASTRPAVVLDPFGGTGTTALVAHALGRIGITVDRSHDYSRLAQWRTTDRGELAKAMRVPRPAPVPAAQLGLFEAGTS